MVLYYKCVLQASTEQNIFNWNIKKSKNKKFEISRSKRRVGTNILKLISNKKMASIQICENFRYLRACLIRHTVTIHYYINNTGCCLHYACVYIIFTCIMYDRSHI